MSQYKKINRGYSITYSCLFDKMTVIEAALYQFLKSMNGYDEFDLSERQMQRYFKSRGTSMTRLTIRNALKTLENMGIIKKIPRKYSSESQKYIIDDEKAAVRLDPNGDWNRERSSLWVQDPVVLPEIH